MKTALPVTREQDFARWYQAVIDEAGLAEESGVRGCMIVKPWGWAIWENMVADLDRRIKETGHQNCYFPLLIPLSHIAREAEHVEGFAKEMAVVTHHRLKQIDGVLRPDPDSVLEEPLIIRPTSETIIGSAMSRWIQSYRDLPLLLNQWANVMRWEMRPRMFLRTSEFLWQEGHTAHADAAEARAHARKMVGVYEAFVRECLALPVVMGAKPSHERFPGAETTYSIEAMMQDGRALQAGTSHYLADHFAKAQEIRYQDSSGALVHAHTTSWGVTTRLIGGMIMTHGDDDGLRLPPRVAPHQIVIVPMLRGQDEDSQVLDHAEALRARLAAQQALGAPLRVHVDRSAGKPQDKRWSWIKRGVPILCELGPRDAASGQVSYLRRDRLRGEGRLDNRTAPLDAFVGDAPALCAEIQEATFAAAKAFRDSNIHRGFGRFDELAAFYQGTGGPAVRGWVEAGWCRPEGDELDAIVERLKALKLTVRVAPLDQPDDPGRCLFTGAPAAETVLIGRTY